MFKSDEEVDRMLSHSRNGARVSILGVGNSPGSHGNNYVGAVRRTTEEKADIAVLANLLGNQATSEMLSLTPPRVSHIKNGLDGKGKPDQKLKEVIDGRLSHLRNRALDKVELFMEMLSTEKSLKMKGRDLASSAERFVNIYEKLGPRNANPAGLSVQVIFHAPRIKESSDYQTIDVEANVGD